MGQAENHWSSGGSGKVPEGFMKGFQEVQKAFDCFAARRGDRKPAGNPEGPGQFRRVPEVLEGCGGFWRVPEGSFECFGVAGQQKKPLVTQSVPEFREV